MTYRELLELYKKGKLEEEKQKEVEADIEKQDAISNYLFQEAKIPELEELKNGGGFSETEGEDLEARFVKMVNRSIRRAFLKMGACVGAVVLAIVLAVIFILPGAVDSFYYDPGKTVTETRYGDSVNTTNQMSLDMAVYTELMLPGNFRDNVVVDSRGYGNYDISIPQNFSLTGRFYHVSGKIERGKLTLYDMNTLVPMTGNRFGWFQRERTDISLLKQDEEEHDSGEWKDGEHIMHGAAERESMEESLEKLNENEYYLAYVTLNEMMGYEEFLAFYESRENLGSGWCAVKTNEAGGNGEYFRPDNAGFWCDLTSSTFCGWDKEKYPDLLLWENVEDGYENAEKKLKDEAGVKQHFVSLLRYLADQKQFCEMMNVTMDLNEAADYVEKNGVTVYGFAAIGDKEALMELSKMEEVYVIDAEELR